MTDLEHLLIACVRWDGKRPDIDPDAVAILGDWIEENKPDLLTLHREVMAFRPSAERVAPQRISGGYEFRYRAENVRSAVGRGFERVVVGFAVTRLCDEVWALEVRFPSLTRAEYLTTITISECACRCMAYTRWQVIAHALGYTEARLLACCAGAGVMA